MSGQWYDVDNVNDPEDVSPFAMGTVDRLAYVDDDSAVELRGGDIYANIPKPEKREKPQARLPKREQKWSTEVSMPKQPSDKRDVILAIIRFILILSITGALAFTVWFLVSGYQKVTTDTNVGGTTGSEIYQVAK